MKTIYLVVLFFVSIFYSCTNNVEEFNKDIKNANTAPASALFNNAIKNMAFLTSELNYGANGAPWGTTRILAQQISSVTYNEGATYFSQFSWDMVYEDVLINLKESYELLSDNNSDEQNEISEKTRLNEMAQIEIMFVYVYSKLVESFGDIPYTEALDIDNVAPKFDNAETVYLDLLDRLDAAINSIDPEANGFDDDIIYNGELSKWISFGNSLKLQMGMRIIESNPEVGNMVVKEAIPNVFHSNEENALFRPLTSTPNTSQLWFRLAVGGRRDFVAAEPFMNIMNELNDARREVYFKKVKGEFKGSPPGEVVNYDDYSEMGEIFYEPDTPVIFLDYATIEFLLAEAGERSIDPGLEPEKHYNNAIRASFDYYDVNGVEDYLTQPEVNYKTANGEWREKIGIQKWIQLFNQGLEAWTEYRRLDYPKLDAPNGAYIDKVPVRLTYPIDEQNLNQKNYENASEAIGGDLMTTKLFWDIN